MSVHPTAGRLTAIIGIVCWATTAVAAVVHLEAEDYKDGGSGVGYWDNSSGNLGGSYRTDDVDIESTSDVGGGYNVGWTGSGEWLLLTTDTAPGPWYHDPVFPETSHYVVRVRVASPNDDKKLHIDVDGAAATRLITVPNTYNWQSWTTVNTITTVPIEAGSREVKFVCETLGFNVNWVEFEPTSIVPAPAARLHPLTGHYYQYAPTSTTWDQARADAAGMSFGGVAGHLATIENAEENLVVRRFWSEGSKWIGLTDSTAVSDIDRWDPQYELGTAEGGATWSYGYPPVGEIPDQPTERGYGFKWLDGTPLVYQNWAGGEPNDAGDDGEDAVQIGADGLWNDHRTGLTLGQTDHLLPSVVEYDTVLDQQKFDILERKADTGVFGSLTTIQEAKDLLALPSGHEAIAAEATGQLFAVSFADPEAADPNSEYVTVPFLTDTTANDDYFALRATARVDIPTAGQWTFALTHDDLVELTVGGESFTPGSYGTHSHVFDLEAGPTELDLVFLECSGDAGLQLFAAEGSYDAFDPLFFRLVGDEQGGGLSLVPEPSSLFLLSMGVMGLLAFALRKRR